VGRLVRFEPRKIQKWIEENSVEKKNFRRQIEIYAKNFKNNRGKQKRLIGMRKEAL